MRGLGPELGLGAGVDAEAADGAAGDGGSVVPCPSRSSKPGMDAGLAAGLAFFEEPALPEDAVPDDAGRDPPRGAVREGGATIGAGCAGDVGAGSGRTGAD